MSKRGGYKREKPLYNLQFEGEEFDGLEVMARSIPLREFFDLQKLQQAAETDADAQREIIGRLCGVIQSWNLVGDDDKPVPVAYAVCKASGSPGEPGEPCSHHQNGEAAEPCEYTGLCEYDLPFVLRIFFAWMEAVGNIPNLSKPISNDGGTSRELSIPMEVASPSLPS